MKKNEFNLELIEENILAINKIVQEIKEEMKTYYSQKADLEKQLVNINVILQSTSSLILPAYEEKIEDVIVQYQEVDIDILIDRNKRLTTEIKELEKEILKKSKDVNGQFSKFKNFINDDDWKNIDDNMMGNLKTIMSHESLDISDIERFVQQSQNIVTMAKSKLEMDDYHLNRLFERMQDYIFKISSSIRSLRQHSKFNDFQGLGKWSQTSFLEITLNMLDGQHQQIEIQKFLESELTNIELSDDRDMFKFLQRIFQNCCESSKINIMKPTLDDSVQKVKIKESVQWSGGEKLTTGLLLFMALVKARRSAKLQNNEKITLIQDNSIGTANLPRLVDLQIQMAKQAGIQLIYFTGLNDLDSLRRFPIIISVKNTQMQSRDGIASKESHIIVMDKQNDLSQSSMESQIELASIYKKEI